MRSTFTFFCFLAMFTIGATAQNITGIWKGKCIIYKSEGSEDGNKLEFQVEQLYKDAIKGVYYSFDNKGYFEKAEVRGSYTKNRFTFSETKIIERIVESQKVCSCSSPCLITYYLRYQKKGNLETLIGTYTSKNVRDKSDCGSGDLYLRKTTASYFYKEKFLIRREDEERKKQNTIAEKKVDSSTPLAFDETFAKKAHTQKPPTKPGAEDNTAKVTNNKITSSFDTVAASGDETVNISKPIQKALVPDVIRNRNNELVKTLRISTPEIKIDLYDNGEIDGDTISVYNNNRLIASKKRLTDKPISFTIKVDENVPVHKFVMVAENLGSIPPNTALMIITSGDKRYEVFLASTEQKNAMVIVEYNPKDNKVIRKKLL